jgi:Ca-activated chloride channel family protein
MRARLIRVLGGYCYLNQRRAKMNFVLYRIILFTLFLLLSTEVYAQDKAQTEADNSSKPIAYGLVVDNTGSLRAYINEVIETGKAVIENNQPDDEVFITRFTHSDNISIVQDFTSQKAKLSKALDDMYIEGGLSAILDAVYQSAQHLAENNRVNTLAQQRRALVLMTDGAEENSYYRMEKVLSMLREKGIKVYVIGFPKAVRSQGARVEERAGKFLNRLAEESGGRLYLPASKAEELKAAQEIIAEIRNQ